MTSLIINTKSVSCWPMVPPQVSWLSSLHQPNSSLRMGSPPFTCRISTLPPSTPMIPADQKPKSFEELQEKTRKELLESSSPTATLEFIDSIQRLGVGHHFEEDIRMILERFVDWKNGEDLFATALRFRLLRHNGFPVHSDVFSKFTDKDGTFKEFLTKDPWGLLTLYEASYLGTKDEVELIQAMEFTTTHLQERSFPFMAPQHISGHVSQAFNLPRHLRMPRLEARNYIHEYSFESNHSSALLKLAQLDFNSIQSLHRKELVEIVRWWKQLDLVGKLGFARDRPLECYLWTVGIFPEPYNSTCRIELTKTIAILLVIDDIFDTYGSLPDLVLFTEAIRRWDLNAIELLPEYMKICYMALYNTTNDIGYMVLKHHGLSVVHHLKRTWIDMIEAFLIEAKWFNNGYVPTIEEYLDNGVTTGGTFMALVHSFFLIGQGITKETLAMLKPYPPLFSFSGRILRLWDDLGTAGEEQERGDVASSIECFMREKKISCDEEGRKQVRQLIRSLWRDLNGELKAPNAMPLSIINASLNLARTAQVVYQHGDDMNACSVDDQVQALIYRSIPFRGRPNIL